MNPIFTLDARDNVQLEVMGEHLGLSTQGLREIIVDAHSELIGKLETAKPDYADLRTALVPQADRREGAFIFDSAQIHDPWYGGDVAAFLLPLLNKKQRCSVLFGDLIHPIESAARALLEPSNLRRGFRHTSLLYAVYLNNLSHHAIDELSGGLSPYYPYLGFVDCTLSSPTKDWLSKTLPAGYVKCGSRFVGAMEDDWDGAPTRNLHDWPLAQNGYSITSVRETLFDLFLSYKIERAVQHGYEFDNIYALAAISGERVDPGELSVEIAPEKLDYLLRKKSESLRRADLLHVTPEELASLIRDRLSRNYLYNLRYEPARRQSFFNIMLELPTTDKGNCTRLMTALEYLPTTSELRVVTMF